LKAAGALHMYIILLVRLSLSQCPFTGGVHHSWNACGTFCLVQTKCHILLRFTTRWLTCLLLMSTEFGSLRVGCGISFVYYFLLVTLALIFSWC